MEYEERDTEHLPTSSAAIVLVYRPPAEHTRAAPLTAKIQVRREQVDDLRARLENQPALICEPDPSEPGGYRLTLP